MAALIEKDRGVAAVERQIVPPPRTGPLFYQETPAAASRIGRKVTDLAIQRFGPG